MQQPLLPVQHSMTPPQLATPTATIQPTPRTIPTPAVIPTPTPIPSPIVRQATTIDDSIEGTGLNQFNYVSSRDWGHNSNTCQGNPCEYNNSNSWDTTSNDYVTLTFTGIQIKFYGLLDPNHG